MTVWKSSPDKWPPLRKRFSFPSGKLTQHLRLIYGEKVGQNPAILRYSEKKTISPLHHYSTFSRPSGGEKNERIKNNILTLKKMTLSFSLPRWWSKQASRKVSLPGRHSSKQAPGWECGYVKHGGALMVLSPVFFYLRALSIKWKFLPHCWPRTRKRWEIQFLLVGAGILGKSFAICYCLRLGL